MRHSMIKSWSYLCLSGMTLAGCHQSEEVDWIEVPLQEHTYFDSSLPWRTGSYDILVLRKSALEFKLGLKAGTAITYYWDVEMNDPELLSAEFHGHTHRVGTEPGTVMFYKVHADGRERGTLIAPFDGIHGWYLDNQSREDITVRLTVAGFYEEIE